MKTKARECVYSDYPGTIGAIVIVIVAIVVAILAIPCFFFKNTIENDKLKTVAMIIWGILLLSAAVYLLIRIP